MSKVIQIFAKDAVRPDGVPKAEHLFALYDDGRVYEHFSDDGPDDWFRVRLPKRRKRRERRK